MTSKIDPNSINANFPQADQNNNSQGFRDNFSAIQQALGQANIEISGLQDSTISISGAVTAAPEQLLGPIDFVTSFTSADIVEYKLFL